MKLRGKLINEKKMMTFPPFEMMSAALTGQGKGALLLSPLELSTQTALDLDQVKAVVGQLRERGYLESGDQTITIDDPAPLRDLHDLVSLKEEVRHRLGCR